MSETSEDKAKKELEKLTPWGTFTHLVFAAVVICLFIVLKGWVLGILWNWFVPTVFVGLPQLTTLKATGLILVANILCKDTVVDLTELDTKYRTAYIKKSILKLLVTFLLGWILQMVIALL